MGLKDYCKVILSLILVVTISGCVRQTSSTSIPSKNAMPTSVAAGLLGGVVAGSMASGASVPLIATMGAITGGAVGLVMTRREGLLDELSYGNVQLVQVGEDIMLVLPSHNFFYANSSHLNEKYFSVLDYIAKFINNYETTMIKVAGYTDSTGDPLRSIALSRQQAQNIAQYLTSRGVNARYVYATGYGSDYSIATNSTEEGRRSNNRVQISFRQIPKDPE